MKKHRSTRQKGGLSICFATAAYILFLLMCILFYAVDYLTSTIEVESFSQLLYTVSVGMGGAGNTIVQILQGFAMQYLFWIVAATVLYGLFMKYALAQRHSQKTGKAHPVSWQMAVRLNSTVVIALAMTGTMLVMQLKEGYSALKIDSFLEEQQTFSSLYEDEYVKPDASLISAPAKKKNLIYIYMESMEASYASRKEGGGFDINLIPGLTRIAKENTDFSASDDPRLNGGQVTNKTSWTVAGIVAQTSGTPLGVSNGGCNKNFENNIAFLPEVVSLGDILKEDGYHNVFMCGSEAAYAGRANYFRQHGAYEIFDVEKARQTGHIPEDYNEWWGFEDSKLIEFAKEKIENLAADDRPFNFTMLTADTHFKDGYLCPDCPDERDEQYENVILCSDRRIAEFVDWIQKQSFAKDTIIVLAGDHLSMDGLVNQEVGLDFPRRTYAAILNGPEYKAGKTRQFTTMDLFPTTLEAMGYQIEGDRLGLGTSLYGERQTLCESMGFDQLNEEISYRSKRFEEEILKGDGEEY